MCGVVLFLVPDVIHHIIDLRLPDRKRAITFLPIEIAAMLFHPNGTVALDIADEIADVDRFAERDQQMNVIRSSVGDDQFRFVVMNDSVDVGKEFVFDFRRDQFGPILS
jgi:hypothetical protein